MNSIVRMNMFIRSFVEKKEWTPSALQKKLECGRHTIYRTLQRAVAEYNMPVEFDRKRKVYRYIDGEEKVSFPLIWFTPRDVMVLLTLLETFKELPIGIFDSELKPFKTKLSKVLKANKLTLGGLIEKIKVVPTHFRRNNTEIFSTVCESLALNKKLKIKYRDRQNENVTERVISPIQIVRYKDIWYLDAYCHKNNDLRIFSLDRIEKAAVLEKKSKKISKKTLNDFFQKSYGIFAGKPQYTAVLKFSPNIARWVSAEEWHPDQKCEFTMDGFYILSFPYSDERELILDILRYGDGVEVLSPQTLRNKVKLKLENALEIYNDN